LKVTKPQRENQLDRRLQTLADISVEIVNTLAERKVDGISINVADIYFVLSKALQHVSLLNLAEIEDYKKRNKSNRFAV
jgi:uncharacterized protein YjgD (DUF1641 family)